MLVWLAEGLRSDEINKLAAEFKPKFEVSRAQLVYYRKTRKVDIEALKRAGEGKALSTGLAIVGERVKVLKKIAARLQRDLFEEDLYWLLQVKGVGAGAAAEVVEYEEFNRGEIDALRGVLDDIAKETGGRVNIQEHKGSLETTLVHIYIPDNERDDKKD